MMVKQDSATIAAFSAAVLLGGLTAIGIAFVVQELDPFWVGAIRFAPAALLLFLLALVMRIPMPAGRGLLGAILFGVLDIGASAGFIYWGMQEVPAGMASVVLALVPLMTLIFAMIHGQEIFTWRALGGALLAVGGIAVIFGALVSGQVPMPSLIALFLGVACMAEANVIIKVFPSSHPVSLNAVAMTSGAVILFLLSFAFQETPTLPATPVTWFWLIYLILVGSCVVFILFLFVLGRWTASAASYAFVLMSVVGVLAAALLLDEQLTLAFALGAALVLGGVYIGALTHGGAPHKRPEPVIVEEIPDCRKMC